MAKLDYVDYKTPADLASCEILSKSEKIRLLEIWVEDEQQLCIAAAEGMAGGTASKLKAAQRALDSLT
jgi:hypothetical protein